MSAGTFEVDWLALREPFDRAARALAAEGFDWAALQDRLRPDRHRETTVRVIDLACGTGANLRELAPRIGGQQHWLMADHDGGLLAALPSALQRWAHDGGYRVAGEGDRWRCEAADFQADIELRRVDLVTQLDDLPFDRVQLVTGSALLDLVSEEWLSSLVDRCAAAGLAMLFALSVDGVIDWSIDDVADAQVQASFAAHQQRDKGFGGNALGASAVDCAVRLLARAGYRVDTRASDWRIDAARGAADAALLKAMVEGLAGAARDQAPDAAGTVDAWQARRLGMLASTRLTVGHADVLALPALRAPSIGPIGSD